MGDRFVVNLEGLTGAAMHGVANLSNTKSYYLVQAWVQNSTNAATTAATPALYLYRTALAAYTAQYSLMALDSNSGAPVGLLAFSGASNPAGTYLTFTLASRLTPDVGGGDTSVVMQNSNLTLLWDWSESDTQWLTINPGELVGIYCDTAGGFTMDLFFVLEEADV